MTIPRRFLDGEAGPVGAREVTDKIVLSAGQNLIDYLAWALKFSRGEGMGVRCMIGLE